MISYIKKFSLLLSALLVMSCGGDSPQNSTEALEQAFLAFNDTPIQADAGYYYTIVEQGSGDGLASSDFLLVGQKVFDIDARVVAESGDLPIAASFSDLTGVVRESLERLNEGGTIRVYSPAPQGRDPSQVQIFELKIEGIYEDLEDFNTTLIEEYLAAENLEATITDDGIYAIIENEGSGTRPELGSMVSVTYRGYFLNGSEFDSSNGSPITFALANVIQGWQLGIPLFMEGGKGTIIIPSRLAYGPSGNNSIPGNYPLVFDVELVEVL